MRFLQLIRKFSTTNGRILLVDGDQNMLRPTHKPVLTSFYKKIHVFKNYFSGQQQPYYELEWCEEHILSKEESIKEAVDHAISFFCGQHCRTWAEDHNQITIVSRDKSFRNVQNFLDNQGIPCQIRPNLPNVSGKWSKYRRI